MDGDPTDNNASQFSQGYNGVLKPFFDNGSYVKVGEPAGTWTPSVAQTTFSQQYTAHPNINSVVTPNDDNANAVIAYLQSKQIKAKTFPTTGQDASLSGLQNILKDYQCGTVYKPVYTEAQAAAAIALYLRAGQTAPSSLLNGTTRDTTANADVNSVLLTPVWVTAQNMASTVVKDGAVKASDMCIAGIHGPDGGQIFWEGEPVHVRTPRDAAALGIETVYQDLALCDNLDIVQNMFLGRERLRHLLLDEEDMENAARQTLTSLAVTTVRSIRQPVASLSGGQRQSVAIAKAVLWNSKLVIMDEPTAALGVAQTAMVLDLVRRLADRGLAVVIVSHNMNDVFQVADRIAVLHLGRMVAVRPAADLDRQIVVDLMTTGASTREVGRR